MFEARTGANSQVRGRALENAARHLIQCVPGVVSCIANAVDYAEGGEIDLLFANRPHDKGFWFLPTAFLVECKNWQDRVGSQELRVLIDRLRERACTHGILFAANGITGDHAELTAARHQISRALEDGRHVMVVSLAEVEALTTRAKFIELVFEKWMKLKAFKTSL